jgi:bifunctional DNA-binding transcriptional regulator/antitoxin component of YhaV-PrlF toxin-antitoxin module
MPKARPRPYGPAQVGKNGQITPPALLREDVGMTEGSRVTFYWWPGERRVLMVVGDDPTDEGYEPIKSA